MSRRNVDAVRRCLDGWNRADLDAWLEGSHPEIEWFSAITERLEGAEKVWRGPAELRRFWAEWRSVWNMTIEVIEIRDLGDTVLALGSIQARGKASGIAVDGPVAYVFEFERGLARRIRSYLDPGEAFEAVGLER